MRLHASQPMTLGRCSFFVVSSQNQGDSKVTPMYYNPCKGHPGKGILNLGRAPLFFFVYKLNCRDDP